MTRRVDILVIGAGIYGACAAYESVRRGFSVALVDRHDLGSGTSSSSLKILHGGLRYLQHLDIPRAREAIRERRRWLVLLPHLTAPLPFRLRAGRVKRWILPVGLIANALLSFDRNRGVPPTHHLPAGRGDTWYDAIVLDTEQALLSFVHGAAELATDAFHVHTHANVDVAPSGTTFHASVNGEPALVAERVIRAVGAHRANESVGLSMNLVLDRPPLHPRAALALAHPCDGRQAFVVPWRGHAVVGTYDRDYPHDPSAPLRLEEGWIDEMLTWVTPVHPAFADLRRRDVRFVHAGILPRDGSRLRDHPLVTEPTPGWIEVSGVKYTTAYGVAISAVDRATRGLPPRPERAPSDRPLPDVLVRRDAFAKSIEDGTDPLGPGGPRRGDVLFAVRHEWATSLDDVLLRRTGTASAGHPGAAIVHAVADVLAREWSWSADERTRSVADFDENPHFAGNGARA